MTFGRQKYWKQRLKLSWFYFSHIIRSLDVGSPGLVQWLQRATRDPVCFCLLHVVPSLLLQLRQCLHSRQEQGKRPRKVCESVWKCSRGFLSLWSISSCKVLPGQSPLTSYPPLGPQAAILRNTAFFVYFVSFGRLCYFVNKIGEKSTIKGILE